VTGFAAASRLYSQGDLPRAATTDGEQPVSRPRAMIVFGARPNLVKVAPLWRAMMADGRIEGVLVDTGQHYDPAMSDDFLATLELPDPDVQLGVGPGSQSRQIAGIITALEPVLADLAPDVCIVVGDVSSTMAAAMAASIAQIPVAHIEAGLRSRNWAMPEERNRVITDRLSRWLFTPSNDVGANLAAEGIDRGRIHFVGNIMIDSLDWILPRLDVGAILDGLGLSRFGAGQEKRFGLVTLHRPSNVDDPKRLAGLIQALVRVSDDLPLVFPVHPRTALRLKESGMNPPGSGIRWIPPLGYNEFVALMRRSDLVLTDSGGIQEEAVVLGTPCLTLLDETDRPITLQAGNELVGTDPDRIVAAARRRLATGSIRMTRPPLWDGHTAERVLEVLAAEAPSVDRHEIEAAPAFIERRLSQTDREAYRPLWELRVPDP
jgi:UDP-N-acetylglucosamine 2-epimerase (non-hydrolysing)